MPNNSLINKYNVAGPRYTSYPTVPFWETQEDFNPDTWQKSIQKSFKESNSKEGISLYIHLPYCDTLCTFCACHKHITKLHSVEKPYIDLLLKEWALYTKLFNETPIIKELHLGGGTPTFFSPENLRLLIHSILNSSTKHKDFSLSFEAHPNYTTLEHFHTLYEMGSRRISFGIQDYSSIVQKTINRNQSLETVKKVTEQALKVGYNSINHDLVYGLPKQTLNDINNTIEYTKALSPERIAFYGYAHVPWRKGVGQRGYSEADLPKATIKRNMYEYGKKKLQEIGYHEIGMDHFAKSTDTLYKSAQNKSLHRNFMGYTDHKTTLMVGLGMSAISDTWYSFGQNKKTVADYKKSIENNIIPIFRGHCLSKKDLIVRKHILNLMCLFETSWENDALKFEELENTLFLLKELEKDNLIKIERNKITVCENGKPFIRNICMAFDLRMQSSNSKTQLFSKTI